MKKIVLTVMVLVSTLNITTSQTSINDVYSCVNQHFNNLTYCFDANDVTGRYTGGGNTLYFQADAGITYNQMSTCVENYNKDRVVCPTAPLLVLGSSMKKKKVVE